MRQNDLESPVARSSGARRPIFDFRFLVFNFQFAVLPLLAALANLGELPLHSAQAGPGAVARAAFQPIDFSRFAKKWDQFRPDECWAVVPRGLQTLGGVPFQMEGILEVTGLGAAREQNIFYPTRLTGIPVGRKGHRLHLLHGAGYDAPDGTPVAKLLAHYADGSEHPFYLSYGVHTRNWWREPAETKSQVSDPNTLVAWTYTQAPWNLRLYKTTFDNPYPEREIKTLDLISLLSRATPVVVAITLEDNPAAPPASTPAGPAVDESACRREVVLRFVDQAGQPVPGAVAKLTLTDAGHTFDYGANVADAGGQIVVDYPANQVRELALAVRSASCLPARLSLTNAEPGNLPPGRVVKLEPGVNLGGIVRDPSGQPIAGARVSVNTVVRDEVGQSLELETDVATTDDSGQWTTRSVAADFKSLTFKLTHPDFRPAEYYISDSSRAGPQEGSKAELLAAKAVMVMEPGTRLAGAVTDAAGKPLAGADVLLRDSADPPKDRFASTDSSGRFKFVLMEAGQGLVAVAAKGFSPQSAGVTFEAGLKAVAFKLQPAKPLTGRVVGPDGKPIPGATVALAAWNDLPFPKWQTQTDANGSFSWDSAPADGALYSVRKDGYVPEQRNLAPGEEDLTFVLKPAGLIVGEVVDAETREPIPEFQVIVGHAFSEGEVSWQRYNPILGSGGKYSYHNDQNFGTRIRLLVEAKGYLPQASAPLTSLGWFTNNFELKKGDGPRGIVLLPDGQPAAGVRVALLSGDYTLLKDAELQQRSGSGVATTDAGGKFALPAAYASVVVAANSQGYAEAPLEQLNTTLTLTLQPWGCIEGIVRNGPRPATNQWVMVAPSRGGIGPRLQYDFDTYRVQADDQGRFVLTNVPPGQRFLTRLYALENDRGWTWSHGEPITVRAGQVTPLEFGGKGRTVIGKVVPNEKREIPWQSGQHTLGTSQPRPSVFRTREEAEAWENSPEAKEARARYRYYVVQFADDGSLRIEDVPPGKYELNLSFHEPGEQNFASGPFIGSLHQEVEVPEMPNRPTEEPLDLGRLDLVVQNNRGSVQPLER